MRCLLPAAFLLLALPAHAQTDVLCSSLDRLAASASGMAPFEKIGAVFSEGQGVARITDRLPGVDAETCVARMPASAARDGAAIGEFWEFSCILYSDSSAKNEDARAEAWAYRDNMAKRVKACLAKKGWAPPIVPEGELPPPYGELHLTKTVIPRKLPFEIVVGWTNNALDRTEQIHTAWLSFRLHGGPKPPEVLPEGVELRGRN